MASKKTATAKKVTKKKGAKKKAAAGADPSPQSAQAPTDPPATNPAVELALQELLDNQRAIRETQREHGELLARVLERESGQPADRANDDARPPADPGDRFESLLQESLRIRNWVIVVAIVLALLVLVTVFG